MLIVVSPPEHDSTTDVIFIYGTKGIGGTCGITITWTKIHNANAIGMNRVQKFSELVSCRHLDLTFA